MGEHDTLARTARLEGSARLRIGARLRTLYARVREEPLPAEHVELVLALRRKERDERRVERAAG
jgi:hypothetical protein